MRPVTPSSIVRETRNTARFKADPVHTTLARHIRKTYDNDDLVAQNPGTYEIVRELGAGEFGTATLLKHLPSQQDIVVKRYYSPSRTNWFRLVPSPEAEEHASTVFRILGLQAPRTLSVGPDKGGNLSSIASLIPGESWPQRYGTADDWVTRQWLAKEIRSSPFLSAQILTSAQAKHYVGQFDSEEGRNTLLVHPKDENGQARVGHVDFDLAFGEKGKAPFDVFDDEMVRNAVYGIGGKEAAAKLLIANNERIRKLILSRSLPNKVSDYLLSQIDSLPESALANSIKNGPIKPYVPPGPTL